MGSTGQDTELVTAGSTELDTRSMLVDKVGQQLAGREVLVTGATGFIGSHLVERLVALGARVIAVGPALGWRPVVPDLVAQGRVRFVRLKAFWHPASVRRVRQAFGDAEYVVHLGYVMPAGPSPLEKAVDDVRRNVLGTLKFIRLLPNSVSRICFSSSAMIYGSNSSRPVAESDGARPATAYAAGKLATEIYLGLYAEEKGVSVSNLRYATVYGRMETVPRAIPNFIRQVLAGRPPIIYGDGEDIRDYVHVLDVIDATTLALVQAEGAQVYNVGSGKGYATREIAERIIQLTGKRLRPTHEAAESEPCKLVCDITLPRNRLGYQPQVELDDGLSDEIRYFACNPRLWRKP